MAALVKPDQQLVANVRRLLDGKPCRQVAKDLDLAEATVARLAAALPVQPGTILLAEAAIARVFNTSIYDEMRAARPKLPPGRHQ